MRNKLSNIVVWIKFLWYYKDKKKQMLLGTKQWKNTIFNLYLSKKDYKNNNGTVITIRRGQI